MQSGKQELINAWYNKDKLLEQQRENSDEIDKNDVTFSQSTEEMGQKIYPTMYGCQCFSTHAMIYNQPVHVNLWSRSLQENSEKEHVPQTVGSLHSIINGSHLCFGICCLKLNSSSDDWTEDYQLSLHQGIHEIHGLHPTVQIGVLLTYPSSWNLSKEKQSQMKDRIYSFLPSSIQETIHSVSFVSQEKQIQYFQTLVQWILSIYQQRRELISKKIDK